VRRLKAFKSLLNDKMSGKLAEAVAAVVMDNSRLLSWRDVDQSAGASVLNYITPSPLNLIESRVVAATRKLFYVSSSPSTTRAEAYRFCRL